MSSIAGNHGHSHLSRNKEKSIIYKLCFKSKVIPIILAPDITNWRREEKILLSKEVQAKIKEKYKLFKVIICENGRCTKFPHGRYASVFT